MKILHLVFIQFFLANFVFSQEGKTDVTSKKSRFSFFSTGKDSTELKSNFELSFGQNLLFISTSKQNEILQNESVVLATSSVLFFSEFRPRKVMRIPVFLNIATESKQFLVNGNLLYEKASPTIGTGIIFKAVDFRIDKKSKIELEIGPLVSMIFNTSNSVRFAPILASRIKICRGENFVMYLGINYSLGVKAFGLMYGTGTVF